jgi:serine/threonine protein kinase
VNYIASQGWDGSSVEIFMGLKEGTLESLVWNAASPSTSIAGLVFVQMLQALDCLEWNGIVHRDVKPANILYTLQPDGQHQFQLGDFGLCNRVVDATTFAGSRPYMAPEMFRKGGQTSKLDVWSLFVTMLWTLDVGEFRQRCNQFKSVDDLQDAVSAASKVDTVSKIREMAIVNPEERASAAQMLVKCFNGTGLSTPRSRVPALTSNPCRTNAIGGTRDPAPPAFTTRTAQKRGCKSMQIQSQPLPSSVSRKLKHNTRCAGYMSSAENHRSRVEFLYLRQQQNNWD